MMYLFDGTSIGTDIYSFGNAQGGTMATLLGTAVLEGEADTPLWLSIADIIMFAFVLFLMGCAVALGRKRLPQ